MSKSTLSIMANQIYSVSFEAYKSYVCHMLKDKGDLLFLQEILLDDTITRFYANNLFKKCLYLLAMTDYISKEHHISLYSKYDSFRELKLAKPQISKSIEIAELLLENHNIVDDAYKNAIPEFLKYNIIEGDIRNVV